MTKIIPAACRELTFCAPYPPTNVHTQRFLRSLIFPSRGCPRVVDILFVKINVGSKLFEMVKNVKDIRHTLKVNKYQC